MMHKENEKIVVQVSADIHINKEDYTFEFEELIRTALENAGFEVCGIEAVTSWSAQEYFS